MWQTKELSVELLNAFKILPKYLLITRYINSIVTNIIQISKLYTYSDIKDIRIGVNSQLRYVRIFFIIYPPRTLHEN